MSASFDDAAPDLIPGRSCPLRYRYGASAIAGAPLIEAQTLYVVGGLYGNVEALDTIEKMVSFEKKPVRICFNGDFNWFNVDDASYLAIMSRVLEYDALLGNVEAELGSTDSEAGCGCAYPETVAPEVVERSNRIHAQLKQTANRHASLTAHLEMLPMFARYLVGSCRVGVVHGDADSLAGWLFSRNELTNISNRAWLERVFEQAQVDVFASSHTCEPIVYELPQHSKTKVVINNGAAGMPNAVGQRDGRITRISVEPFKSVTIPGAQVIERSVVSDVEIAAISVPYDHLAWRNRFLANWPKNSDAYDSYYARIMGESL
jgi:hypothetical protein